MGYSHVISTTCLKIDILTEFPRIRIGLKIEKLSLQATQSGEIVD